MLENHNTDSITTIYKKPKKRYFELFFNESGTFTIFLDMRPQDAYSTVKYWIKVLVSENKQINLNYLVRCSHLSKQHVYIMQNIHLSTGAKAYINFISQLKPQDKMLITAYLKYYLAEFTYLTLNLGSWPFELFKTYHEIFSIIIK